MMSRNRAITAHTVTPRLRVFTRRFTFCFRPTFRYLIAFLAHPVHLNNVEIFPEPDLSLRIVMAEGDFRYK